mgnify:CR=1
MVFDRDLYSRKEKRIILVTTIAICFFLKHFRLDLPAMYV